MPEPLSPKSGFGMKVTVLPASAATFLMTYLKSITLSADLARRVEAVVDLLLTGGADLVVGALHVETRASSSARLISSRRSEKWSTGGTGK